MKTVTKGEAEARALQAFTPTSHSDRGSRSPPLSRHLLLSGFRGTLTLYPKSQNHTIHDENLLLLGSSAPFSLPKVLVLPQLDSQPSYTLKPG